MKQGMYITSGLEPFLTCKLKSWISNEESESKKIQIFGIETWTSLILFNISLRTAKHKIYIFWQNLCISLTHKIVKTQIVQRNLEFDFLRNLPGPFFSITFGERKVKRGERKKEERHRSLVPSIRNLIRCARQVLLFLHDGTSLGARATQYPHSSTKFPSIQTTQTCMHAY